MTPEFAHAAQRHHRFWDCLQEELRDESQRECACIIYASPCTLLGMINAVLDFPESGWLPIERSRTESVKTEGRALTGSPFSID